MIANELERVLMASHRIHLRGPWEYSWQPLGQQAVAGGEPHEPAVTLPQGTVTMPQTWQSLFGDQAGSATFQRRFHRPTNIGSEDRLLIVLTEVRGSGIVVLNGDSLGSFTSDSTVCEFEIANPLAPFNLLSIEVTHDPTRFEGLPGGLLGPVALEIRTP